jgi:hypothetical protein
MGPRRSSTITRNQMQAGTQSPSSAKLSSAHPNSRSLSIGKLNPNPKRNCKAQIHHQQTELQTQIQETAQSTSPICSSHPVQSLSSTITNNTATGPSPVLARSSVQLLSHSPCFTRLAAPATAASTSMSTRLYPQSWPEHQGKESRESENSAYGLAFTLATLDDNVGTGGARLLRKDFANTWGSRSGGDGKVQTLT